MSDSAKVGIKFVAEASSVSKASDDIKKKLDEISRQKVTPQVDFSKVKADAALSKKLELPKFDSADLIKANTALSDLQKKIQAVGTSTNAADRFNSIRDSVLALQKFRFEQAAILKESPELSSAYSQVAGQLRIAVAEGRRFAQVQAQAAAEARKLAAARPAPLKAADSQLDGFRDRLNKLNFSPNLGQAAKSYEDILVKLRAWETANQGLIASNSDLAARVQSFRQSAIQGLGDIAQRFQGLAGIASSVAAGFAGVATVFGGVAVGALTVAGTFEQMQARLESVAGSAAAAAEKFTYVQKLAIDSPFDVRGLVQAATTLEGFQLKAEEFLPTAGNLAAAMGKSLPEAALVFAKAASGSTEGFESLRNEYAITTRDLLKFGAVEGKVAGQLSHAEDAIKRNRDALIALINTRYGDAMERQSKTLQGAMSNLGDAGDSLAASWGSNLIPIATLGAKALTAVLNIANQVPAPLKALGIAGAASVAGIAGLGAIAGGAVAALLLLQASLANTVMQLRAMKLEAPLASAALQTLSVGANRVSGLLSIGTLRTLAFRAGWLALAATVVAAGLSMANSWEKNNQRIEERTKKSAQVMADATEFLRNGIEALDTSGKSVGVSVEKVSDAADQMKLINSAFANIPKDQVVSALLNIGVSADQLKEQLKKAKLESMALKERLNVLTNAQAQFQRVNGALIVPLDPTENQRAVISQLREMGLRVSDVDQAVIKARTNLGELANVVSYAAQGFNAFQDVLPPMQQAATASKQLSELLNLSKQVGTTQALATGLTLVNDQITRNNAAMSKGTDNLDALLARLSDPKLENDPVQKGLIEAQIKLVEQRTGIIEAQAAAAEKAAKAEVDAQERAFRRKKALGEANLHDELYFVQQRLKAVQQGSEEEVTLLERASQLKSQINADQLTRAKARIQKEMEASKQAVADAQAGIGGQTALGALEQQRVTLKRLTDEFKPLIAKFPELGTELEKLRNNNAIETQKAKTQDLKNALTTMVQGLDVSISEAVGSEAKLAAVNGAIAKLKQAQANGYGDIKENQAKIVDYTKQQLALEKDVSREKQQQAITLAQADLSNLDQSVQILQADTANAAANEGAITAIREEGHRRRLALIEQEKQAAIELQGSRAFAEAEANRKIQAEEARFGLERIQATTERKQRDLQNAQTVEAAGLSVLESEASVLEQRKQLGEDVEQQISDNLRRQVQERVNLIELEKQQALANGQDKVTAETAAQAKLAVLANQEKARMLKDLQDKQAIRSRVFGPNSPVYSDGSEGLGISLGDFRLGDLRKPASLPTPKFQTPRFNGGLKPVGQGGGQDAGGGGAGQGAGGGSKEQQPRSFENWTLNFTGLSMFGPEFENAVLAILRKAWSEARNRAS